MIGEGKELATVAIGIKGASDGDLKEVTPIEVILGESMLTPGLQTSVRVHSFIHSSPTKWFDRFKGQELVIEVARPILAEMNMQSSMTVNQKIYRVDNRKLHNNNVEQFTIRACDQSQLNDAGTLVSKSWKCTTPSQIVDYALRSCAGVTSYEIQESQPARDYVAENIHPFQVVAQQANYALDGDDPSFVHFMTYDELNGRGVHHFESLKEMSRRAPIIEYTYNETNTTYLDPRSIMTYSFPCDFDLLSDILNGVDASGKNVSSVALFNPVTKSFSMLGNDSYGCGVGSGVFKAAISNMNSPSSQDSCPDYASVYLLKRQARMNLLERDKIAFRVVVPWNPSLHAGEVIRVNLYNKDTLPRPTPLYGSGDYLILHMFHHILTGGMATTVMDCVASTVGRGEV
jgi:hypothetical protein